MSLDVSGVRGLINGLLDQGYTQATRQVLTSIQRDMSSGIVAQRLRELDAEVMRLTEAGQRLTPDNPVFRALMADTETQLSRIAARVDAAGGDLTEAGMDAAETLTRQLALPGIDDGQLARIGVAWNRPDPEQLRALVDYIESDAWADAIGSFPDDVMGTIRNQIIRGQLQGWSSARIYDEIARMVEGFAGRRAQVLMRTLQLEAWRTATAAHQLANADILVEQIRIGTLDARICMACIARHGERLPLGEKITDHHLGRCTSISVVRGRPRSVMTGPEWWASLPRDRKIALAGPGAFEALERGAISLRDFVQPYTDPVFGQMMREASLKGMLGDAASQYYQR